MLYPDHPYGHFVGGSVAGLKAATPDRRSGPMPPGSSVKARLTIGVAGGLSRRTCPNALKTAALESLPAGEPVAPLPAVGGLDGVRMLLVEKKAPAVAFSLGAPVAFDRAHPDFAALMVGVSAFGEHRQFHGRLMQRLREERGLNYGDYAYPEFFRQDGWSTFARVNIPRRQQQFSIWLRPVQATDALFALRLALHEYDKLLREGLTADEVQRAARFLEGYTRLFEKDADRRLGLAIDDAFNDTPERLEKLRAALPGLTAETVNAALRKHLPPVERLSIVRRRPGRRRPCATPFSRTRRRRRSTRARSPPTCSPWTPAVAVRPFDLAPESRPHRARRPALLKAIFTSSRCKRRAQVA
jgi:zinc protease